MSDPNTTSTPNNSTGLLNRIGTWFKGGKSATDHAIDASSGGPSTLQDDLDATIGNNPLTAVDPTRSTFFKPWGKRDAALANLQDGFNALTGLMGAIKENLEQQNRRQDDLMQYMSHLPQLLQTIPETGRSQTEALQTIAEQIKYQNTQQARLGEILDKVSQADGTHREVLESLHERVEALNTHDRNMADSLQGVGSAMQNVSRTAQSSAQVLEQMRDTINSRQAELHGLLHKQSVRYTTMLAVSLFLAIAAVVAVCVFGYLMLNKMH